MVNSRLPFTHCHRSAIKKMKSLFTRCPAEKIMCVISQREGRLPPCWALRLTQSCGVEPATVGRCSADLHCRRGRQAPTGAGDDSTGAAAGVLWWGPLRDPLWWPYRQAPACFWLGWSVGWGKKIEESTLEDATSLVCKCTFILKAYLMQWFTKYP